MYSERGKRPIQIVVENGEAAAVIVGMQEYVEMLERLEDLEMLNEMRSKPLEFRKLEDFIERSSKEIDADGTPSFASRWRGKFKASKRGDALAKKYLG